MNRKNLSCKEEEEKSMPFSLVKPVIDFSVRLLCYRAYPGHKRGCPNYDKRDSCPPKCLKIHQVINLEKSIYIIWNKFTFWKHRMRMKGLHPEWSDRQTKCCLYWQPKARQQLQNEIYKFRQKHPNYKVVKVPEATGVNVTKTMKTIGIKLEWPPVNFTYQVAIAGKELK